MAKRDRYEPDRTKHVAVSGLGGALSVQTALVKDKTPVAQPKPQPLTKQQAHKPAHTSKPAGAQPKPQPSSKSDDRWSGYETSVGSTSSFHDQGPSAYGLLADGRWIGPDGVIIGGGGSLTTGPDRTPDDKPDDKPVDPTPQPQAKPGTGFTGLDGAGRLTVGKTLQKTPEVRKPKKASPEGSKNRTHEVQPKDAGPKKTLHEVQPKDAERLQNDRCKPRPTDTRKKSGGGAKRKDFVPWC